VVSGGGGGDISKNNALKIFMFFLKCYIAVTADIFCATASLWNLYLARSELPSPFYAWENIPDGYGGVMPGV
jgi:hypothetical protein